MTYRSILFAALVACAAPAAAVPAARVPAPAPTPSPPARTHGRVVVTSTDIEILSIRFIGATTNMTPDSQRYLDSIAQLLDGNPSLAVIEVLAFGSGAPPAPRI